MENKFSENYFQLIGCFEGFDPEMVWSENFHFKLFPNSCAKKERERERESLRLRLRRLCQSQPSTSTSPIYESIDLRIDHAFNVIDHAFDFADFANHAFNFTDLQTDLRPRAFDPRTFDFAGDLEPSRHEPIFDLEPSTHKPSTSPATQSLRATNPRTDLSLSLSVWFSVWVWLTNEPIYVSVWFWFFTFSLWSLIFLLLLEWWCFGGFPVVWWWVLCGWWWKITFSEYYQTHENIFWNNFHNATKYLKIFLFFEIAFLKNILYKPNIA